MGALFYLAAAVAVCSTIMMITRLNAVHALLYLVVSLLAVAIIFYLIGAPFIAALEVIIYAGAIMVLFLFVVMMLNLGDRATTMERSWLKPGMWIGPLSLSGILICELGYILARSPAEGAANTLTPKQVGMSLFGPYLIGVELASMLLLGGLVGAYHLGCRQPREIEMERKNDVSSDESGASSGGNIVCVGSDRFAGAP